MASKHYSQHWSGTVILVIVLTIIFVVHRCLHAKLLELKNSNGQNPFYKYYKKMGIVRECLTGGFQRAVPHKSSVPYQFLLSETSGTARRSQD